MGKRFASVWLVLAGLSLVAASCSSGKDGGTGGTGGGTVKVRLQEFAVIPVSNAGPKDEHELVVLKTDLAPDALPTKADGSMNEDGAGVSAIGEIEEFAVGKTETITFELTAGKYVLICNIVHTTGAETEVHYKLGMRTAFTVT